MLQVPQHHDKVTIKNISDVTAKFNDSNDFYENLDSCSLIREVVSGVQYDFLWAPKENADKIFVFFSGDILRKKNSPPVFQRWSWAKFFPGSCLYVSDPTLVKYSQLTLAWYLGDAQFDPMEYICSFISELASKLGVLNKDIVLYGSSGGGFAALRSVCFMNDQKIVAINPQIDLSQYDNKSFDKYLATCFDGVNRDNAFSALKGKSDIRSIVPSIGRSKIVYVQNDYDLHHYNIHFKLFCDSLGEDYNVETLDDKFCKIIFSHPDGHGKAETQEAFDKILGCITL